MNTAARRTIAAAGATRSQGKTDGSGDAMATGIDGGIELIQSICREMQAQGEACILLSGADPGFLPARYHPAYRPGRRNVNSFCWRLGDELKGTDVTAICVVPGMADEDYFERPEEIGARVAADVSSAWTRLHAAMSACVIFATATIGFDRS